MHSRALLCCAFCCAQGAFPVLSPCNLRRMHVVSKTGGCRSSPVAPVPPHFPRWHPAGILKLRPRRALPSRGKMRRRPCAEEEQSAQADRVPPTLRRARSPRSRSPSSGTWSWSMMTSFSPTSWSVRSRTRTRSRSQSPNHDHGRGSAECGCRQVPPRREVTLLVAPFPDGATCTCNCVPGQLPVGGRPGGVGCTCDKICTCIPVYRP